MSRREDYSSRTPADAAEWAKWLGEDEYIDIRPTRAELEQEERDAERRQR